MKTLKSITLPIFLLFTFVSSAQWGNGKRIKGNGEITTITRTTQDYNAVKVSGFMDVLLVAGNEGTITLKGESNLLEYVVTEVRDGTLIIKVKDGYNLKPNRMKSIEITATYESLDEISLAGSGDVSNEGTLNSSRLDVSLAGSGDIELHINTNDLECSIAGSGDITLKGSTTNLEVEIAGSGDFSGFNLDTINADVRIAGSGEANIVCNGNLKGRVSGSGDIRYNGNPKTKDTKVTGSGSVSN